MNFKQLSYHTALTPGADLWILPKTSFWAKKLDWYVNFQISKPPPHPSLSSRQIKSLKELDLPYFPSTPTYDVLMIASENFLPNLQTVILPFEDLQLWIEQVHKIWANLNHPSLRLFLPDHYLYADITERWPNTTEIDIYIVEFKGQKKRSL